MFDLVKQEVKFDLNWVNDEGYLDMAVSGPYAPKLENPAKCTDVDNRKIIMVPSPLGNLVVFERYNNDNKIVTNVPREVQHLAGPVELYGVLTHQAVSFLLGDERSPDLGTRIRGFHKSLQTQQAKPIYPTTASLF